MPNFANIEQRVNQAINKKLANATADFGDGLLVGGIFDNEYSEQYGANGTVPVFIINKENHSSVAKGQSLLLGSESYKIKNMEPDGTGMLRLELTKV